MAAKTPSTTIKESWGSLTLYISTFTDIDDGDTWASAIPYPVGYWINCTDDPDTQTSGKIDLTLSTASTGAFTFQAGEDDRAAMVYVLTKSMV
jgi:hypothetical protein